MVTACMLGNHLARRRSSFLELTESTTVCGDAERWADEKKRGGDEVGGR